MAFSEWFSPDVPEIEKGDHVLVFGCGPLGRVAISSMLIGGRVIAVDRLPDPLAMTERPSEANQRRYYGVLLEHVKAGQLDPQKILTQTEPMTGAIEAARHLTDGRPAARKSS